MSSETEFTRWLHRPEKSFGENLQFALKAWKSADFTLSSKYQVVLQWISQQGQHLGTKKQTLQVAELNELLQLKCQPGLITQQVKTEFIQMWLEWAIRWQSPECRVLCELLQQLIEYEIVQDLYRSNYELYAQLFGQLLQSYEHYLLKIETKAFLATHETKFFMQIMNTLRGSAKNYVDLQLFDQQYTRHVLVPLVQVHLAFQQYELHFFDDFLALEQLLCQGYEETAIMERIMRQPLHVCLMTLECAIVNQRGVEEFQKLLLKFIFQDLLEEQRQQDPALALAIASYTLEMFLKHDISLNFGASKKLSALDYLSRKIDEYVQKFKEQHLQHVLQLLCSTLHLNPLVLEKNIFQYTIWMIVAEKSTPREQELFEHFLILLMDMFRKLSCAESFVVNLLRTLGEWLQNYKLTGSTVPRGKCKLKGEHPEPAEVTPAKKRKLTVSPKSDSVKSADGAKYLEIIFKAFRATGSQASQTQLLPSFPSLETVWPWSSVGVAFSKLVMGLMSKPSLVVCKTLIFNLKDVLKALDDKKDINENDVLQLDFIAALLCQYFAGCKLAEQSDKFWDEITTQRELTADVLNQFGRFLLNHQHNKRWMNAFLECSYYASHYQLIIWYYRSDRFADAKPYKRLAKQMHDFLSEEEWALLQQRVINFGKAGCKFNMNRLRLQRSQARMLFASTTKPLCLQKIFLAPIANDLEQLQLLLRTSNAQWLTSSLSREEKMDIVRLVNSAPKFDYARCGGCTDDLEFFELLCLGLYEQLAHSFSCTPKKSILGSIKFDELKIEEDPAIDKRVALVAEAINARIAPYALKKLPTTEVQHVLEALKQLPIGSCRRQIKGVLFALHLALFRDLKASQQEELAADAFDICTKLLHFGQQIQIFKYFSAQNMLQLLPVASCWEFYEFLYSSMKNEAKDTDRFLSELLEILKTTQQQGKLDHDHLKLTLKSIETLSSLTGPGAKRLKNHLSEMLAVYANHVKAFFGPVEGRSAKKDNRFVERTLPGFAAYVKSMLANGDKSDELNEDFRRICKIYIGYSMNYNNAHAIKLITMALNYHKELHFDQDEIEFVLNGYWSQLNADLKAEKLHEKNAQAVVKLVIGNKTNEDLLLLLKDIGAHVKEYDFASITSLLILIAKCSFSTIKGAIFNEQFKQITFEIMLRLQKDEQFQYVDTQQVLRLLACQQVFVENKMAPLSADTMDDILAFLIDIKLQKFPLNDTNGKLFISLHLAMTELCTSLLKHRHVLLMDRVPQFVHIFKDLLQSIVWYKSDRQVDTALSSEELDDLANLSMKLEAMMHIVATHAVEVKRVASFILTFTINLMVANKRSTTLYPKIKTHIDNICYDLIGICDHRVGRFILRCTNEAARQVYEKLTSDHKKYHKFKGKV